MAYYEAVAEAAKIGERNTKLFREALSERAAERSKGAVATPHTCAHMTDAGECVWHTRTWSDAPGFKPKRCNGCPALISAQKDRTDGGEL